MARLTRQVGIRSAQVRLPGPSSAGPAIVKTAAGMADRAFEKQADKLTQEAQIAAADLNLERDGDGNLAAPRLPLSDNGMLTPSIYDRKYTEMVSNRYLNQSKIDTSERLNLIASKFVHDPEGYKTAAEAYVNKVTELAPDMLKPDVNQSAQMTMVEHFNRIVRVTGEKDHAEAKEYSMRSLNLLSDDLHGLQMAGATPEAIVAKVLELRANILEGRDVREGGFGFHSKAAQQDMFDQIDRRLVINDLIAGINELPDNDLAYAVQLEAMTDLALGIDTKVTKIDEFGQMQEVDIMEIFPNPADRELIASTITGVLETKVKTYSNLRDERLNANFKEVFNWLTSDMVEAALTGQPLDLEPVYAAFKVADRDVIEKGYAPDLRNALASVIEKYTTQSSGKGTKFDREANTSYQAWVDRMSASVNRMLNGRDPSTLSDEELQKINEFAMDEAGFISFGSNQSEPAAEGVGRFYNGMTSTNQTHAYWDYAIDNPDDEAAWGKIARDIPDMAKIGLWSQELRDTILGRLQNPEGLSPKVLKSTMSLAKMLWDHKSFRTNMMDSSALGTRVGGALQEIFDAGVQANPSAVMDVLANHRRPGYQPHKPMSGMSPTEQVEFKEAVEGRILNFVQNRNYLGIGGKKGAEVPFFNWKPFADEVTDIPDFAVKMVIDKVAVEASRIDPENPSTIDPFIGKAVKETFEQLGLGGSKLEYSPDRYSPEYVTRKWPPSSWVASWDKPTYATVMYGPETMIAQHPQLKTSENPYVDVDAVMEYVFEDFQKMLDKESKMRWPDDPTHFTAGKNAATRYSSVKTGLHGETIYEVVLIHNDGMTIENLTEGGVYAGNNKQFSLEPSIQRYIKDQVKEYDKNVLVTGQQREWLQNNPAVFGSPYVPLYQRVNQMPWGVNRDLSSETEE